MHFQILQSVMRRGWLPLVLTVLVAFPPVARSQAPAPPQLQPIAAQTTMQSLRVMPLAGDGEVNDLERGIMAPLVVQVLDRNSRPVEGTDVTFRFPVSGPSATFPNQQSAVTVRTNADGQAAATGWKANSQMGSFQVRITATRGNEVGEATVTMTNAANVVNEVKMRRRSWWSSRWVKIGAVAGAVTAVILLTRGNGADPDSTITISPGSPTIGGPQ